MHKCIVKTGINVSYTKNNFSFTDRKKGFVRSVTPHDAGSVTEVRQQLRAIKERCPELTYDEVTHELATLRSQFVDHKRCRWQAASVVGTTGKVPVSMPISRAACEAFRALGSHAEDVLQFIKPAGSGAGTPRASNSTGRVSFSLSLDADLDRPTGPSAKEDPKDDKRNKKEARRNASCERAKELKQVGKGLFAECRVSPELQGILGRQSISRTEALKEVWRYIKDKGLQKGRTIQPDRLLKKVCPVESFDCFKLNGMLRKHLA